MKRITVDGVTGVALWGDEDSVVAFLPDGSREWSYIPRTVLLHPSDSHTRTVRGSGGDSTAGEYDE